MTGDRPAPPSSDEELAQRYGRPPTQRRRVLVAIVCVVAGLGVGWVVWAAADNADRPVNAELQSYEVTGDTTTEVTLVMDRRGSKALECVVYAQAADHSTVGELVIEIPPGDPGRLTITDTITTQRRAVNGVLRDCTTAD
ncbi:MAG: DUF4307 domain-containing protein [Actinomycetota bacterium]|nr:DUF4307 domain-containing protein [Actinomycetota bacterium]